MRHRPKPALLIFGLLTLASLIFLEIQGNYLLGEFRAKSLALIKEKIGLEGDIGAVEGGIFRGIILKDVRLYGVLPSRAKEVLFSSAAIDLNYRLWDIALGRYGELKKITFVSPKLCFFETENKISKVSKAFDKGWKEIVVSIRDGSLYNAQNIPAISELNGDFRLSERGIESQSIGANILGQRFTGKGSVGFPIEHSAVTLEGSIKGRDYALKIQLKGVLDNIFVQGSFDIPDRLNLSFAGNIAASEGIIAFNDFRFGPKFVLNGLFQTAKRGFSIKLYPEDISGNATAMGEVSKLAISGDLAKLPYFALSINANHLKMLGFDLLSNYSITGKLNCDANSRFNSITGDFSTSGSVINYDPIRELKGAYELKDGMIKLTGVNYGDVVYANGSIGMGVGKDVDLHFKFKGVQIGGLTDLAMEKGSISGLVYGDMDIRSEPGKDMNIDGQLELLDGNISVVHYNSAKIALKGKSSVLEFVESKVYTGEQVLTMEGKMDLVDLGTPRLLRNVVIKSDPNTIIWAGVNVTRPTGAEGYSAATDSDEQFKVNFRVYESQQADIQRAHQDAVELEYKLAEPTNTKLKLKENDDFFGVEHKVRF